MKSLDLIKCFEMVDEYMEMGFGFELMLHMVQL